MRELILQYYTKYIHFIKYAVIGVTGVTIDFLVFYLLTEHVGMYYQYANAISVTCGITNNFIWNAIYNFKVKDKILKRFIQFYAVGIFGLLLNALLLFIFIELLDCHVLITKAIVILIVVVIQFFLNTKITFKKSKQ